MQWLRPFILAFAALALPARAEPVLVAAAADLQFALEEVLGEFRTSHPDFEMKATYGSSGTLFAQITNGAPFDLFLSADAKFPRQLIEGGSAERDSFFLYATGHLVLWVPNGSPLDLVKLGWRAAREPAVRKLAIANPDVAPYGAAAVAALKSGGIYGEVEGRLVRGENVSQAAQFAQSGAADAGLISLSLALCPKMKAAGRFSEVPAELFPKLEQAGVLCTRGKNRTGAAALRDFLHSAEGHAVLARYGFTLPGTP